MNIGLIAESLRADDSKIKRIEILLRSDSELLEILTKNGSNFLFEKLNKESDQFHKHGKSKKSASRLFQSFLKAVGVGALPDNKKLSAFLRQMPNFFGEKSHRGTFARNFYRDVIFFYITEIEADLQKLLLELKVEEKEYTTAEIYQIIKLNRLEFSVSTETVNKFFKYWWFDDLEEEVEKPNSTYDLDYIVDEISKLKIEVNNIHSMNTSPISLGEFKAEVELVKNRDFIDARKKIDSLNKKSEESLRQINVIASEINEMKSFISSNNEKHSAANGTLKSLPQRLKKIESDLKSYIDDKERGLQRETIERNTELSIDFEKKLDIEVKKINERILNTIGASQRSFLDINSTVSKFPLLDVDRKSVSQEEVFLNAWKNYLSLNYGINLTLNDVIIYHNLFKSQSFVVLENANLVKSWIECLGAEEKTAIDTASPLWVSKLDWLGLSVHLETKVSGGAFGIISNFNVGVVEAYLIPTLKKWTELEIHKFLKLFFIVDSLSDDKLEYERIFSLASKLPSSEINRVSSSKKNIESKDSFNISRALPKIKNSNYKGWVINENVDGFRKVVIDIPRDKWGINFSEVVLNNFVNFYSNLLQYFNSKDSLKLSIDATLSGYILIKHDQETLENFTEFLLEFF